MTERLPDGFTVRPATPSDARGILAVGLARDVADSGRPDWSLEDVEAELRNPGLSLDRDSKLVLDEAGEPVAFAYLTGIDARVGVHPDSCGRGIGTWIASWVESRAREAGADRLRQEFGSGNEDGRVLLERHGYELEQRYWCMWRELDGSEPQPHWPDGLSPRPFEAGTDERAAYELVSDAMRDVPGNTERTFEEWTARALTAAFAPDLSVVVEDGDAFAGVAICQRRENATGAVDYIAVSRRRRAQGVGRAVLATALQTFAANGLRRAELWVNGRNESATRLYRSTGLEEVTSAERYVKRL